MRILLMLLGGSSKTMTWSSSFLSSIYRNKTVFILSWLCGLCLCNAWWWFDFQRPVFGEKIRYILVFSIICRPCLWFLHHTFTFSHLCSLLWLLFNCCVSVHRFSLCFSASIWSSLGSKSKPGISISPLTHKHYFWFWHETLAFAFCSLCGFFPIVLCPFMGSVSFCVGHKQFWSSLGSKRKHRGFSTRFWDTINLAENRHICPVIVITVKEVQYHKLPLCFFYVVLNVSTDWCQVFKYDSMCVFCLRQTERWFGHGGEDALGVQVGWNSIFRFVPFSVNLRQRFFFLERFFFCH